MKIRFRSIRQPMTQDDVIERYRRNRAQRRVVGIAISDDFSRIEGAVIASRGSGKWLRTHLLADDHFAIPDSISQACQSARKPQSSLADVVWAGSDLSEIAAAALEQLLAKSGSSAEDVLAVAVSEPSIEVADYDGQSTLTPMFQPQRCVEIAGLSVIDGLPLADRAAGGRGEPLYPLAWWLMFADRHAHISRRWRWIANHEPLGVLVGLPPSDGLDAELPKICCFHSDASSSAISALEKIHQIQHGDASFDLILADGGRDLDAQRQRWLEAGCTGEITSIAEEGCRFEALAATTAAVLGIMHIDQLPASLPWLTGCDVARLHGRLTPGRPAHWRRLLREMADYHPPAMKLRDAV